MSVLNSHIKTEESKSSSENLNTLSSNNPINIHNTKKLLIKIDSFKNKIIKKI